MAGAAALAGGGGALAAGLTDSGVLVGGMGMGMGMGGAQMIDLFVRYVDISWPSVFISWFKWTGIANLAVLDLAPVDCMQVSKREQ